MPPLNRNKIESLISILLTGTRSRMLKWNPTADENAFRLESPSANVRVARSDDYDPQAGESFVVRSLSVLNDKGRVIEEFTPDANHIEGFDTLFSEARRSAYNTDEVLDKLMKELQRKVS